MVQGEENAINLPFVLDAEVLAAEYPTVDKALAPLDAVIDTLLKAHPVLDAAIRELTAKKIASTSKLAPDIALGGQFHTVKPNRLFVPFAYCLQIFLSSAFSNKQPRGRRKRPGEARCKARHTIAIVSFFSWKNPSLTTPRCTLRLKINTVAQSFGVRDHLADYSLRKKSGAVK